MITVIEPASSKRLISMPDAKDLLPGVDENALEDMLDQASAAIASYCNRVLAAETVRQVERPGCASNALILARRPVISFASVEVDGLALAADGYELDAEAGLLYRLQGDQPCSWYGRRIVITYTAGYVLPGASGTTLPADITRACEQLLVSINAGRSRDPLIRSETTEEVGSTSWLDPRAGMEALPPSVAGLLAPYRSLVIG